MIKLFFKTILVLITQIIYTMKKTELARYIDSTILKPDALENDIITLCNDAKKYNFKAVCISPCYVKLAKSILIDSETSVCTVIGFPHGLNTQETKIFEGIDAISNGANELDIVVNNSNTKSKKFDLIEKELKVFCKKMKEIKSDIIIKVIIETAVLNDDEKIELAKIVKDSGADFVKTSTGFAKSGATIEDVKLLRKTVGDDFKIKASGGIRDYQTAIDMINSGANRLGVSAAVAIVEGAE